MTINSISLNKFENTRTINSQLRKNPFATQSQVAFRGMAYDKTITGLAKVLGKLANTQFVKKTVGFCNGKDYGSRVLGFIGKKLDVKHKWFQHAVALESIYLTSFYMYNTKKSPNIPEDQKRAMMTNQALVTTLCTTLAYTIDNKISKAFSKMQRTFNTLNVIRVADIMKGKVKNAKSLAKSAGELDNSIKMPLKTVSSMANGISKLKSVLVFGFIYRYFSPVFITPIANRVSDFIDKKIKNNSDKKL